MGQVNTAGARVVPGSQPVPSDGPPSLLKAALQPVELGQLTALLS